MNENVSNIYLRVTKNGGTIEDFIKDKNLYGVKAQDLFDFNKGIIYTQMTLKDKKDFQTLKGLDDLPKVDDLGSDMILSNSSKIMVDRKTVTTFVDISPTDFLVDNADYFAFADEKISEILQNKGYQTNNLNKVNPDCSVFGWFKSLYYISKKASESELEKYREANPEFSNLSKYIISLSTIMTANGGSFTFRLPIIPIMDILRSDVSRDGEKLLEGYYSKAKDEFSMSFFNDSEFYSKSSFNSVEDNYFSWLISSNDLMFLSFEKLEMETRRNPLLKRAVDIDSFGNASSIEGNVYDMIGLIDSVSIVTDSASSSAFVEVSGRDLMKLLIEDGSFFFNPSTSSDPSTIFNNITTPTKTGDIAGGVDLVGGKDFNPADRVRGILGEIDVLANTINKPIGFILKSVISKLANIEVVPGYIFEPWGSKRTKHKDLIPMIKK